MGQTLKDSGRLQAVSQVYEILRRADGSFDIFGNGELADHSIPDQWLEDQLAKYGICGQEYRLMRRKLEEGGEARFVFSTGQIKSKLRTKDDSTVELEGI